MPGRVREKTASLAPPVLCFCQSILKVSIRHQANRRMSEVGREPIVDLQYVQEENTVQYVLLIYADEANYAKMSEEDTAREYQGYIDFDTEVEKRGASLQGGKELQAIASATTVRVRDGKTLTTDGPFAETKESLGGFYILNCNNLDEAIEIAAKIPGAEHGSIEIRPVVVRE